MFSEIDKLSFPISSQVQGAMTGSNGARNFSISTSYHVKLSFIKVSYKHAILQQVHWTLDPTATCAATLVLNHTPVGELKIVIFVFRGENPTYFLTLIPMHPT